MDHEKLRKMGDRCIYDEPAACTAWCPVHMDVVSFVAEMEKGNFNKAYKVMEKMAAIHKSACHGLRPSLSKCMCERGCRWSHKHMGA